MIKMFWSNEMKNNLINDISNGQAVWGEMIKMDANLAF